MRLNMKRGQTRWRLALGMILAGGVLGWSVVFLSWAQASAIEYIPGIGAVAMSIFIDAPLPGWLLNAVGVRRLPHAALNFAYPAVVFGYAALGLLVALALSMRFGPRIRRALLVVYALWLASLLAQLLLVSALVIFGWGESLFFNGPSVTPVGPVSAQSGLWVGWLAALLGVAGLALGPGAAPAATAPEAARPRSRLELASAALASIGAALWCVGFFTLPWATQGCSGLQFSLNHFVRGSCAGLDSADTIARSSIASAVLNPFGGFTGSGIYTHLAATLIDGVLLSMLLLLLAICALAQLWLGSRGVARWLWLLGWLALACWPTALATQGAIIAITHPQNFTYAATGPWVYGPGLGASLVGLALAGLAALLTLTAPQALARWSRRPDQSRAARYDCHRATN